MSTVKAGRWPPSPLSEWEATRDTLQVWTQVVGKVRMVNEPLLNHWWNVPLYVSARGLTTSNSTVPRRLLRTTHSRRMPTGGGKRP